MMWSACAHLGTHCSAPGCRGEKVFRGLVVMTPGFEPDGGRFEHRRRQDGLFGAARGRPRKAAPGLLPGQQREGCILPPVQFSAAGLQPDEPILCVLQL
mmetsp:Transcript_22590/g.50916  ORF Transcript_22590/g.50916 Transcript_22590/m.50916 type:complete len:99 (+) Transcript_22590:134-430(+)